MVKAYKNTDFVLGRANPCLPQRGNSPLCRLGATLPSAAEWELSAMPPMRTSGPGSAVAERNLGAARPLRNVIVAAYPLRNVIGSRLPVA